MLATAQHAGFDYETVPGDPIGVKIYTMANGLKLYLSVNPNEPRIQTNIAVRAGSKHDPEETTGLAHYLEHMLFKGTDRIGSLDWAREQVLLEEIAELYEQHRNETDPEKRKEIYSEIDRTSNEAAKLVAANEYDKMMSSLGAKGTNAYTWLEQTVYVNDIPSNQLERWMQLESERFRKCVLRLFHTELEAVYEEFNIGQDQDFRKSSKAFYELLFPSHPYGTQTTIGSSEHLKNPSHRKIQAYFDTYYVPNNMAIVLSGDFDPHEAVLWAERYFGSYKAKPVPAFEFEPQPAIEERVARDVFGQEASYVQLGWRFDGVQSEDARMLMLIRGILYNRRAGIFDLELLQKQKVLEASASASSFEDYSVFSLYGKPRDGQTLEDVEKELLNALDKLRRGEFEEWLIEAVIKDMKLSEIRSNESNGARVSVMTGTFVSGLPWEAYVNRFEEMGAYTKADIVHFAQTHLRNNNHIVVYKRTGDDPNVVKVDKPAITPVSLNRSEASEFTTNFMKGEAAPLKPVFLDFESQIQNSKLASGVEFDYIHNTYNPTFSLNYILDMGSNHDPLLALAVSYLPYLGTDKYSPEQLRQEFFRLGLSFNVSTSSEQAYVTLSGLDESLEEGVKLFEHVLSSVVENPEALENLVKDVLVRRTNDLKDKRVILRNALSNYARYGKENPFTNMIPQDELLKIKAADLIREIKQITQYEHVVYYYGSQEQPVVANILNKHHKVPAKRKPLKPEPKFDELQQGDTKVLLVDFPMVQAEVMLLSKGSEGFQLDEYLMGELYNNYFGFGLSSIVFQEIRESKALAYSAYAYYGSPSRQDQSHYMQAYVGTQSDKMPDAIPALMGIVDDMPVSADQIENAREALMRQIESERITGSSVYWTYRANKRRGFSHDVRQDVYKRMQETSPEELVQFQKEQVQGRKFTYLVLASKDNIDMDYLRSIGPIEELSLEDIFGYGADGL